jgi:serine phosphatase RsbU (regulator of sigma subunit)
MVQTAAPDRSARALTALLDLSKALGSEIDLEALMEVVVGKASAVLDAERTSVYIHDPRRDVLWTNDGQPVSPVVSDVARSKRLTNVRSALAAPMVDSAGDLLGVLECVNKNGGVPFDAEDESLITAVASHVAVAIERARLTSEFIEHGRFSEALKLAAEIQMRMLPSATTLAGQDGPFELHAAIRPAKMVGGDLYDFAVAGERLYFCVGDVSGKGIGSALVMALTKTLFRANVGYFDDVARLTEAVNVRLCEDTGPTMFVTSFCGFLDLGTGMLRFCNAGHDRPFLLRSDGTIELLQSKPGIALGVVPTFRYPLQELKLAEGDALFLYTDGVTEATNAAEELFTIDRLRRALEGLGGESALRVIASVTGAVEDFVRGAPQSDDLTMMCVRYRGARS